MNRVMPSIFGCFFFGFLIAKTCRHNEEIKAAQQELNEIRMELKAETDSMLVVSEKTIETLDSIIY